MANTFETINAEDITITRTPLHEAIPLSGTIVSGTYSQATTATWNVKNYSHGMFQSVYDYPYLSSSANHIFDISFGYSANSTLSQSVAASASWPGAPSVGTGFAGFQQAKKRNVYDQMAQILMGFDATGSVKDFKIPGGDYIRDAYFVCFSRLLSKDEIDKNNWSWKLNKKVNYQWSTATARKNMVLDAITIPTSNNETVFYTDSPAGEYSVLSSAMSGNVGLLFYQAGIAVLGTSSLSQLSGAFATTTAGDTMKTTWISASISGSCDALRHHWATLDFNNTTELNSTVYFCRVHHNQFNYSSNPTYLSSSKIRVKESSLDQPISYITTVGLYGADNELLATAKLSEPLKKTPDTEYTLRVRLDY